MKVLEDCTRTSFITRHVSDRPTRARRLLEFRSNQANLLRRLGGPDHLDAAAQTLRNALAAHDVADPDPESARILSGIQYELAYIDYLTARWQRAIDGLEASADTALIAGDETRAWISRCVAANVAFYAGRRDADAYREVLMRALEHFEAVTVTSSLAQRWIMNVHSSLFDLAFFGGDQAGAEAQFALLQGDRWLAQFGMKLRILPSLNARMFLLRGDWPQACRCYQDLLDAELVRPEGPSSAEGLARNFLEYGQALAGGGHPEQARAIWERGLRCPDHAGNWFWKQRIEQMLREQHNPSPDTPSVSG
jgi:tetratricopeptide (TPR) repeat protein